MFLGTYFSLFSLSRHTFCKIIRKCEDVDIFVHSGIDYSFGAFLWLWLLIDIFIIRYFWTGKIEVISFSAFLENQLKTLGYRRLKFIGPNCHFGWGDYALSIWINRCHKKYWNTEFNIWALCTRHCPSLWSISQRVINV